MNTFDFSIPFNLTKESLEQSINERLLELSSHWRVLPNTLSVAASQTGYTVTFQYTEDTARTYEPFQVKILMEESQQAMEEAIVTRSEENPGDFYPRTYVFPYGSSLVAVLLGLPTDR
jgi:hypothetical protein